MQYGHVTGTRKESRKGQSWYDAIAEARLAEMDAQQEVARFAEVVGDAVSALPQASERIRKAATLVQHHEVYPLTSGSFLVGSESDTVKAYLVRRGPWTCDCADARHRQHLCKHTIAAMLTVKMGAAYHPTYEAAQAA